MFNYNKMLTLRKKSGLKQSDLGKKLNISTSAIGMWEQGRSKPDDENITKMANIFDVTTDYLLDNDITSKNIKAIINDSALIQNMQSLVEDELGKILLEKYGNLTEKDKKILTSLINIMTEWKEKRNGNFFRKIS